MIHLEGVLTTAASLKCRDSGIPTSHDIFVALQRGERLTVRPIGRTFGLPNDRPFGLMTAYARLGPFELDLIAHGDGDGGPQTIATIVITGSHQGLLDGGVRDPR